jgi:hypothetical protein
MRFSRFWKGTGLVAVGLLVGYLIGPTIAEAAGSLVSIRSCCSAKVAKVNGSHQLETHTSASNSSVFAFTEPSGETVLVSSNGTADVSRAAGPYNDIVGVSMDVSAAGASPVTLTLRDGSTIGSGKIIWQGTIQTTGHLDWSAPNALFIPSGAGKGFNVHVANAGGATVQYQVYGFGFHQPILIGQHKPGG